MLFRSGANATTATITVTSIDDLLVEGNETVVVTLLPNVLCYHILTPAGMDTLNIADNDQVAAGNGNGLYGQYYNSQDFTDLKTSRIVTVHPDCSLGPVVPAR